MYIYERDIICWYCNYVTDLFTMLCDTIHVHVYTSLYFLFKKPIVRKFWRALEGVRHFDVEFQKYENINTFLYILLYTILSVRVGKRTGMCVCLRVFLRVSVCFCGVSR